MEQPRGYVCTQCGTMVQSGHKFCGACGAPVPQLVKDGSTNFFGAMQTPGKARLITIRGDQGGEGVSYLLQGREHVAGRKEAQILFDHDKWLSSKHANFLYRDGKLLVRDEGSHNGVYMRIKGPVSLKAGDQFICGEQVFRVEDAPPDTAGPSPDQTYFYSSPKRPIPFRVVQILDGGGLGMVFCAREKSVHIGREDSDLNFPLDVYLSGKHSRIEMKAPGQFELSDSGSKNGTYVRISGEAELAHSDYVFIGHQLLRVEMTT